MLKRLLALCVLTALLIPTALATSAAGQCANGRCPAPAANRAPARYVQPTYTLYRQPSGHYAPAAPAIRQAEPVLQAAGYGDPLAAVNAARAARGLRPLAHDPNLSAWAAMNNRACAGRGLGHHVMAGAAQISASTSDPGHAVALWSSSPAHARHLFDPAATVAGIDHSSGFATANIR